jgi:hypothetical protein
MVSEVEPPSAGRRSNLFVRLLSKEDNMAHNESEKKDEFHFIQLVLMFQTAAMQQMGKLQNPITQKIERDLEQVRFSIDMLEMIQNKTKNNLSDNEKKFLEHALFELRMNYLDEMSKEEQKKKQESSPKKDKDEV